MARLLRMINGSTFLKGANMNRNDRDATHFFAACYIAWVVGLLDPDHVAELDELSADSSENWRQIMARKTGFNSRELQAMFHSRCLTMSDDDALNSLLDELLVPQRATSCRISVTR